MEILNIAREVLELESLELQRHKNMLGKEFEAACEMLLSLNGKLIVSGVGKSGHIGAKIAATLASTGTPSFFLHPTEALHGDLGMISKDDVILAISYSGESAELLSVLPHIKERGIKIISMSKTNSSLSRIANINISLDIQKEACPFNAAPSVSTTLTLALGDALAITLMKLKNFQIKDFAAFHPGGALGKRLFLKISDVMKKNNLPIVHKSATLKEVIATMSSSGLGNALIVDDNNQLQAILSDGDLRRALESKNFSLDAKALDFACKTPIILENTEILAYDALKLLEKHKIQILVVTKDKKPIGVLHIHNLTALGL